MVTSTIRPLPRLKSGIRGLVKLNRGRTTSLPRQKWNAQGVKLKNGAIQGVSRGVAYV